MRGYLAAVAVIALGSSVPAWAGTQSFQFSGSGVSGHATITYAPNPNTGVLGSSPNTVDPVGSSVITGITGVFSDANIGLANLAITGFVPANPAHPEPTNLLAPASFGFYPIVNGPPRPDGSAAPGFSYDNLFYANGSPQAASDYPFHGGFLDIYGMVFLLSDGTAVNFWSNGDLTAVGGPPLTYGAGVTDGRDVLDYVTLSVAAVPEPASWALMIGGFGFAGTALRRKRTAVRFA